jgi:hypothetical protein
MASYLVNSITGMSSSGNVSDLGASVKKRVDLFELHTALPQPRHKVRELEWDEIDIRDARLLGRGAFSAVYSVSLRTHPRTVFALKQLEFASTPTAKQLKRGSIDLALEAKLISYLDHENIIKIHGIRGGSVQQAFSGEVLPFFLLLDYLSETLVEKLEQWRREENALSRLKVRMSGYDEKLLHRIEGTALGVARGIEYLHNLGGTFLPLLSTRGCGTHGTGMAHFVLLHSPYSHLSRPETRKCWIYRFRKGQDLRFRGRPRSSSCTTRWRQIGVHRDTSLHGE